MIKQTNNYGSYVTRSNRNFYSEKDDFTYIGNGELGGKAKGLAFIKEKITSHYKGIKSSPFLVYIPRLTVITTEFFTIFMEQNNLYKIALSDLSDERIAHHFLRAYLPSHLNGELWALIAKVNTPLAVRSSSLLEDSIDSPFAGIYETKMTPNNQPDIETRFHKLTEAIKFVYASTFFKNAKAYMETTSYSIRDEKMAVIIQEVVGLPHNKRYYPDISGVARSYNFYPFSDTRAEDGVISLALGLGKSIVDGGNVWTYSPEYPEVTAPYNSTKELLNNTQLDFWAVNMKPLPEYDPIKETEYLVKLNFQDAEYDNTLRYIASTYNHESDRIDIGINSKGPRLINFAPILQMNLIPLNQLIKSILKLCEELLKAKIEIEFAFTINAEKKELSRFGLLQVRPMKVSNELIEIDESRITKSSVLAASNNVMGNGTIDFISDILYVIPKKFELKNSKKISNEVSNFNQKLQKNKIPYILIGFGRWGSSDPWLGIPITWGQIAGTSVIVESQLPGVAIDLSQGAHFFHNISNLGIPYFSISNNDKFSIDWDWLEQQEVIDQGIFVKHIHLNSPLTIIVDGRKRKGVILK
jgi:hypothetical protein